MNITEARIIILKELENYRKKSYRELCRLLKEQEDYEVVSASGVKYQIEIGAIFDNKNDGPIRIIGAIDDGSGISSFHPLTEDFILSSDGSFIGE